MVWASSGQDGSGSGIFGQRFRVAPSTTTTTTSTTTTTVPASHGRKVLVIKNKLPDEGKKNRIRLVAKDEGVAAGTIGSAADPRCVSVGGGGNGGSVSVSSRTSGQSHSAILPCDNWKLIWKLIGKAPSPGMVPKGYKYSDKGLETGTCKVVVVKNGTLVKAVCLGKGSTPLDYDLAVGQEQAPVDVVVSTGTQSYCVQFGGEIKKDGADGKTFKAVSAGSLKPCP